MTGGSADPAMSQTVRVGSMTALWDGVDLRYVCLAGREVVRRVYVAVRDEHWGSLPTSIRFSDVAREADRTIVESVVLHGDAVMGIESRTRMILTTDNELIIAFTAQALGRLVYNRLGICILHPPAIGDRPFMWKVADGRAHRGRLGRMIMPQGIDDGGQLTPALGPFTELELSPADGVTARTTFTGDQFETEDQRNWTDASFKTYSTPIHLPTPRIAQPGERVEQTARTRFNTESEAASRPGPRWRATGTSIGSVGTVIASRPPMTPSDAELIAVRALGHFRITARPSSDGGFARLRTDLQTAARLGADLELELRLPRGAPHTWRLADVVETVENAGLAAPARVLVLVDGAASGTQDEVTPPDLVARVSQQIKQSWPAALVGGGTQHNFCEVNRRRDMLAGIPLLGFPVSPVMHARDDRSILETPSVLDDVAATAASVFPDSVLSVGPILLARPPTEADTPGPDERCDTSLAACWLLGVVGPLFAGAVASVTVFDVRPGHGLITCDGRATPSLAVLAEFAEHCGADVLRVDGYDPLRVANVAVSRADTTTLYLASLADGPQEIALPDGNPFEAAALIESHWQPVAHDSHHQIRLASRGIARVRFDAGQPPEPNAGLDRPSHTSRQISPKL